MASHLLRCQRQIFPMDKFAGPLYISRHVLTSIHMDINLNHIQKKNFLADCLMLPCDFSHSFLRHVQEVLSFEKDF